MQPFERIGTRSLPSSVIKRAPKASEEWVGFRYLSFMETYGAVTHVEFSPTENEFAATSSSVSFFSSRSPEKTKEITLFRRTPFCGTYRKDGKLLAVGGEYPVVNIFQVETAISLREFAGHTAPVRAVSFSPNEATKLVTGSDDQSVRIWEINTGDAISILHGHEDSVRAILPTDEDNLWVSGSYDGSIKLWDLRKKQCVTNFVHSSPVESLALLSKNRFASAGGPLIKVWDLTKSLVPTTVINIHQKTVTSIVYDSQSNCILSGSLDHLFKVHSLTSDQTVYTIPHKHPITSIALAKDRTSLAVGQTSGMVDLRRKFPPNPIATSRKMKEHSEQKEMLYTQEEVKTETEAPTEFRYKRKNPFLLIEPRSQDKKSIPLAEKYLRSFEYRQALDSVLVHKKRFVDPGWVIALLTELDHRDGLLIALSGRDFDSLVPITRFVHKYILQPEYCEMLLKVLSLIIDLYYELFGVNTDLDNLLINISDTFRVYLDRSQVALSVLGNLEYILNNATTQNIIKEKELKEKKSDEDAVIEGEPTKED